MQELTDPESDRPMRNEDREPKPKPSTMGIPPLIKKRLKDLKIVENEPDYSVIERLMDEHDLKTMRKVVAKKVR